MYGQYQKLHETLEALLEGTADRKDAKKVLEESEASDQDFYGNIDPYSQDERRWVIMGMMGISPYSATATDMDKVDAILQQIEKAKEL